MEKNDFAGSDGGMSENSLGKFKSVDALLHAYGELEAEFTRRSQRLKALEAASEAAQAERAEEPQHASIEQAESGPETAPAERGVRLMGAGGAGVIAPKRRPSSIAEAGSLALEYLKRQTK